MNDWVTTAMELLAQNRPAILVSVVGTRGSAPRDSGARMIVCADQCYGTIGGGHLEYKATALAREQLQSTRSSDASKHAIVRRFPLGASLGQCCGGLVHLLFEPLNRETGQWLQYTSAHHDAGKAVVMVTQAIADSGEPGRFTTVRKLLVSENDHLGELASAQQQTIDLARRQLSGDTVATDRTAPTLWFETVAPQDFRILIFGAGHVGRALVTALATLPCHISWIDSRRSEFPDSVPGNVHRVVSDEPDEELAEAPEGSYVLILTHNHALDEAICSQALQNDTLAYCGLIGSATKRRKFIQRFRARGLSEPAIERLTCPIGLPGLDGKHPGEIAVSVAAQILGLRQQQLASRPLTDAATLQHQFA